MRRRTVIPFWLPLFLLLTIGSVVAQEPAFLSGGMAVRYEEAPGDFHYVFPCKLSGQGSSETNTGVTPAKIQQPALCWPVVLGKIQQIEGRPQSTPPVAGLFQVSSAVVRFTPEDAKNAGLMPDTPPAEIGFIYDAKHIVAYLRTKDATYGFAFRAFCVGCVAGTSPIDPNKGAQLESEYREFQQSLTQFDTVSKRINDLAAQIRVGVTPKNQPTLNDPQAAMGLYSDLNQRFATLCPDAAKSCVLSYAKYQGCKSDDPKRDCGDPPACSAFCAISADNVRGLKATMCRSRILDSASLVPDWTEVARKMEAERKARGPIDPKTLHVVPTPSGPPLDFMGKPIDPDNPCSVESGYATTMMSYMAKQIPSSSVGGALPIGPSATAPGATGPKRITVSAGVIAGNKISGMTPVYPAVAKAAGVQGTVVLQGTISKEGTVENLQVVSGPPLLQQAALDAVKTWRYKPYLLLGQPVTVETQINVIFALGLPAPAQPTGSAPPL